MCNAYCISLNIEYHENRGGALLTYCTFELKWNIKMGNVINIYFELKQNFTLRSLDTLLLIKDETYYILCSSL